MPVFPSSPPYVPLASTADFQGYGSFNLLVRDFTPAALAGLMVRASRAVETRCDRRLAPFVVTESCRADGIDSASAAVVSAPGPGGLLGALGRSRSMAYGNNQMARDVWLREYAPRYPDLWTYSGVSFVLAQAFGSAQTVTGTSVEGPEPDTGHLRFGLGTYIPPGATVRVSYSGGYTIGVPEDLNMATVFMAAKLAIVAAEPQNRKDMSTEELDAEILGLLVGYIRG